MQRSDWKHSNHSRNHKHYSHIKQIINNGGKGSQVMSRLFLDNFFQHRVDLRGSSTSSLSHFGEYYGAASIALICHFMTFRSLFYFVQIKFKILKSP